MTTIDKPMQVFFEKYKFVTQVLNKISDTHINPYIIGDYVCEMMQYNYFKYKLPCVETMKAFLCDKILKTTEHEINIVYWYKDNTIANEIDYTLLGATKQIQSLISAISECSVTPIVEKTIVATFKVARNNVNYAINVIGQPNVNEFLKDKLYMHRLVYLQSGQFAMICEETKSSQSDQLITISENTKPLQSGQFTMTDEEMKALQSEQFTVVSEEIETVIGPQLTPNIPQQITNELLLCKLLNDERLVKLYDTLLTYAQRTLRSRLDIHKELRVKSIYNNIQQYVDLYKYLTKYQCYGTNKVNIPVRIACGATCCRNAETIEVIATTKFLKRPIWNHYVKHIMGDIIGVCVNCNKVTSKKRIYVFNAKKYYDCIIQTS